MKTILTAVLIAASLGNAPFAAAEVPDKWFEVEGAVNTQSSFMIRVDVDRPDRTYEEGQPMVVTLKAEKDCHIYLLYFGANGKVGCLFPNQYQKENLFKAGTTLTVPPPGAPFQFTARPPLGTEILCVLGTRRPLGTLEQRGLTQESVTLLERSDLKGMVGDLKDTQANEWAEARIQIRTVPRRELQPQPQPQPPARKFRRFAVCIGVSQFADDRIRDLRTCHVDAQALADTLHRTGQFDDVVVLCNEQATRAACERAIFYDLPRKTRPGDEVILFFSTHGGRTRDLNGDERDGLDEYIVVHDSISGSVNTMILDDVFARWIRELDGRRVGIILDNCFAGGASKSVKGLEGPEGNGSSLDFLDGEMQRVKDLGQAGTVVLAASRADQVAWEMPRPSKHGVLTYYLLEAFSAPDSDRNRDGRLSMGEAYLYLKRPVENYVRQRFRKEQNPVLLDNANDTIFLRP